MKRLTALILAALLALFCFSACSKPEEEGYYTRTQRDEKGRLSLSLSRDSKSGETLSEDVLKEIFDASCAEADKIYNLLSKNSDGSDIADINAPVSQIFDLDETLISELKDAFELSELTGGLYQPAGGALTELLVKNGSPDAEALAEALSHVGTEKFELAETSVKKADVAAKLDLNVYADARITEAVIAYLSESDVSYGTVTFNGIAGVFGEKPDGEPFLVDISDGTEAGTDGSFRITDGYVAFASKDFGISVDFKDGVHEPHILRAAVYSPDAVNAAVMASVAYTYGEEELLSIYEKKELSFEAAVWNTDGEVKLTKNAEGGSLYVPETTAESEE